MIGTEETCTKPGTDKAYVQDTFRRGLSAPFDPTAAPTAMHYLQGLGWSFGPWAPGDESTASAQDEQSTASKNGVTMNVSIYGYLLTVTAYLPCLPDGLPGGGVQTFSRHTQRTGRVRGRPSTGLVRPARPGETQSTLKGENRARSATHVANRPTAT